MIKRQNSKEDILKDVYFRSLSCFLKESSLYDCLSVNNQVTVVDQSFSLFDVFKVFIENHIDEVLFWNPEVANYDGVFTHTDLIKVTLKTYENVIMGIPNVWASNKNSVTPIMEEEDEDHLSPIQHAINGKLTIDQFNRLLLDLKTISVKVWYNSYGEDLHQSSLVQGLMEDNLNDAYRRILKQNITRIVVTDKESKMIVGIIQQRDILAFLVKGFNQYFQLHAETHHNSNEMQEEKQRHQQHELEIGYFKQSIIQLNMQLPSTTPTYDVFYKLVYVLKRNSIPIVTPDTNQFIGIIDRRDFLFILKYQMFDILSSTAEQFLQIIKIEKAKYPGYNLCKQEYFNMKQTLKEVVENLLLSPRGSLVCLNENKEVISTFQMSDLFKICLDEQDNQ